MAGPSATDGVRSFTMRVYKHHLREATKGSLMVSLKNPEKRTCTDPSISRSTLRRWILENGNSDAADKGQSTYGRKQVLDSFNTDILQCCSWTLFESESYITIKLLQTNLRSRYDLDVKHLTLWRAVWRLGFCNYIEYVEAKNVYIFCKKCVQSYAAQEGPKYRGQ